MADKPDRALISRALISAVIILAPPDVAAFVQEVRRLCDSCTRHPIPPHLTVMWPFLSPGSVDEGPDEALLAATSERLRHVCREIAPFRVRLECYETFASRVLYLAPSNPESIIAVHQRLLAEFPDYPPYGGAFGTFIPHLTVEVFETGNGIDTSPRPDFEPFEFEVTELLFMYGEPEMIERWTTAAVIPLEG